MNFRQIEPIPSDFDSYEEYQQAHDAWEDAMDDYCEEYLSRRRGL